MDYRCTYNQMIYSQWDTKSSSFFLFHWCRIWSIWTLRILFSSSLLRGREMRRSYNWRTLPKRRNWNIGLNSLDQPTSRPLRNRLRFSPWRRKCWRLHIIARKAQMKRPSCSWCLLRMMSTSQLQTHWTSCWRTRWYLKRWWKKWA